MDVHGRWKDDKGGQSTIRLPTYPGVCGVCYAFNSVLRELESRMKSGQKNWNLELVFNGFGIQVATSMWHSWMAMPKNKCRKEKRRFDWKMQPRMGKKHAKLHQASVALRIQYPVEQQKQHEYCSIAVRS